jgi:hypothetical protein
MSKYKITKKEPWGPLRKGFEELADHPDPGVKDIFSCALNLANAGLGIVLELENEYHLGNSDRSIPKTYHSVKIGRDRGVYQEMDLDSVIRHLAKEKAKELYLEEDLLES